MNHQPRILIVRPSALGDVFRSVPVATSLRSAFPDARIDWVVQTEFLDAIRGHPSVDAVVPFPRTELRGWWRSPEGWRRLRSFVGGLRNGYDLAIDAQGLGRSGFMCLASGAPRRIGYSDAREFGWLGLTDRVKVSDSIHAVDRMLAMLDGADITAVRDLALHVPTDAEEGWGGWKVSNVGEDPYVAIAPTSRWRSKEWPLERWVALARDLVESGRRIVVLGGSGERPRFSPLEDLGKQVRILAGAGPLAWSMAAVRDAELVVANDSAMLHAAAGFSRPLVGLFGPTDPTRCGPYGRLSDCIRADAVPSGVHYRDRGLGDSIMRGISVRRVVAACRDRFDAVIGGRS